MSLRSGHLSRENFIDASMVFNTFGTFFVTLVDLQINFKIQFVFNISQLILSSDIMISILGYASHIAISIDISYIFHTA